MKISDIKNQIDSYYNLFRRSITIPMPIIGPLLSSYNWGLQNMYWKIFGEPSEIKKLRAFCDALPHHEVDRDLTHNELFELVKVLYLQPSKHGQFPFLELKTLIGLTKIAAIEDVHSIGMLDQSNFNAIIQHHRPYELGKAFVMLSHCDNKMVTLVIDKIRDEECKNPNELATAIFGLSHFVDKKTATHPKIIHFVIEHANPEEAALIIDYLYSAGLATLKNIDKIKSHPNFISVKSALFLLKDKKILSQETFNTVIQAHDPRLVALRLQQHQNLDPHLTSKLSLLHSLKADPPQNSASSKNIPTASSQVHQCNQ